MSLDHFLALRAQFDAFYYESYRLSEENGTFTCRFSYRLQGRDRIIPFEHSVCFTEHDTPFLSVSDPLLRHAVFLLGMAESVSYWKLACPEHFTVCAGAFSPEESSFWKKLFTRGFGEFYWLNGIYGHVPDDGYVQIDSLPDAVIHASRSAETSGCLVPVGGGKDSVVTLELLKRLGTVLSSNPPHDAGTGPAGAAGPAGSPAMLPECYLLSARQASYDTAEIAGYGADRRTEAFRTFDPQLFRMNREGYLNGHVPFSAILGFSAVVAALLRGRRYIVLSNEGSANEPTVPGTWVNHQYSKSLEFEVDLSEYIHRFLTPSVTYFSLLRPWSEARIAGEFSRLTSYHAAFRSCNRGSRENRWCCECPKCLFVFILLAAHAGVAATAAMFGENLLEKEMLVPILDELAGFVPVKPFECVGTVAETRWSLERILEAGRCEPGRSAWMLADRYAAMRPPGEAPAFRMTEPELAERIPALFRRIVLEGYAHV